MISSLSGDFGKDTRIMLHRRHFLTDSALGFGSLAAATMLQRDGYSQPPEHTHPDGTPHLTPQVTSVIWLFMNGGVSQMESFDPKPMLTKYAGKTIAETPFAEAQNPAKLKLERLVVPDGNGNQRNTLYPLQTGFRRHGESGIEISDWFPHIARHVDKLAFVRSMWTTDSNHGAQTQFHSGRHQNDGDFPNLGAWVHYGLGSLNDNLPQYISMGNREYWNKRDGHYLGPAYDAVPLRVDPGNPLDFSRPARQLSPETQLIGKNLIHRLNELRGTEYPGDEQLAARIASYELAFRMQQSIPNIVDFSQETAQTQALYGLDQPHCRDFGMQLLAARRLVERGVRFIQIQHGAGGAGSWDAHGGLRENHARNSLAIDQPVGGLLQDLEQRGLLQNTLVLFASEFGRTPGSQGSDGRDHHIYGFTVWMAGGRLKRGVVHGATDEIGFHAVEDRHYVTDIHATILHQLGLDSRQLEIPGRKRLDIDHGHVIDAVIA